MRRGVGEDGRDLHRAREAVVNVDPRRARDEHRQAPHAHRRRSELALPPQSRKQEDFLFLFLCRTIPPIGTGVKSPSKSFSEATPSSLARPADAEPGQHDRYQPDQEGECTPQDPLALPPRLSAREPGGRASLRPLLAWLPCAVLAAAATGSSTRVTPIRKRRHLAFLAQELRECKKDGPVWADLIDECAAVMSNKATPKRAARRSLQSSRSNGRSVWDARLARHRACVASARLPPRQFLAVSPRRPHLTWRLLAAPAAAAAALLTTRTFPTRLVPRTNLLCWEGTIEGPSGTPYEGGVFRINITLPSEYPFVPPKVGTRGKRARERWWDWAVGVGCLGSESLFVPPNTPVDGTPADEVRHSRMAPEHLVRVWCHLPRHSQKRVESCADHPYRSDLAAGPCSVKVVYWWYTSSIVVASQYHSSSIAVVR